MVDGMLYVPFGGHFGDCGDYHGWVVGVSLSDRGKVISWSTRARGGGIWAPGGISAVGHSLFVATGNTFGASSWSDGEAVFRLAPDLHRSSDKRDYFALPDWRALRCLEPLEHLTRRLNRLRIHMTARIRFNRGQS
jgi:hypothetical protein